MPGQAKGDIIVTGKGAGWVFDGKQWQSIGNDTTFLQSAWRGDISAWTAGLVSTAQGDGTYIKKITQDKGTGKVTAEVSTFANDVKKAVGDGSASGTANGITVSVTTTSGAVTGVEVAATNIDCTSVTANSATFNDLTVNNTANFTATTVEASSLTVADESKATFGGNTISAIAQREAQTKIDALDSDKDVAGTATKGGAFALTGVTQVNGVITSVDSSVELEVVSNKDTEISTAIETENNHYPTSKAVQDYVTTKMAAVVTPMNFLGVKTSTTDVKNPKNGDVVLVDTKEYVYDGSAKKWVELGDEGIYSTKNFTGEGTVTLTTNTKTLAGGINELDAELGIITAEAMGTTASTVSGAIKELDGKVDTLTGEGEGSVKKALTDAIAGLDSTASGGTEGVAISVGQTDGKLDAAATVTITKATLNSTLGTTNVADKTIATSIGATGVDTALATEKAVRDAIKSAELVWLGADGNAIG